MNAYGTSGKRVLHVITGTNIGGAEVMLLRFLNGLGPARGQHSVVSLAPPGPLAGSIADLGVEVNSLGLGSAAGLPFALARLRRIVATTAPVVVHGWMYHGCLLATLALTRRKEVGLVWGMHHSLSDPALEKRATRLVIRALAVLSDRAGVIAYCSRVQRDQHRRAGLQAARDRLIANALDPDTHAPDPQARMRLQQLARIPAGRLIVGTVGRAHPMKDHAAFAEALAHLVRRGLDVHGVVIGEGQPDGPAVAAAAALGIADRLSAFGARRDAAALMSGFDLYMLSSAWGEAFPLAVMEAMAAGVPAVATDVGDTGELVSGCGMVCPPRDPRALADAAETLLRLPDAARASLSGRCRDRIRDRYSLPGYIAAHADAYACAEALAARRAGGPRL